jgi:hypothetical protein
VPQHSSIPRQRLVNIPTAHPLIESSFSKRFGEKFGN